MKKVMLIAPNFNNYTEIFENSISENGYSVISKSFTPYNWKTAFCKMFHLNEDKIIKRKVLHFNKKIIKLYSEINPDFVIIIRGDFMQKNTLEMIKCPKALWLYDSVTRYPEMTKDWELYDLHYVFENSDVDTLKKEGKYAVFLPLGYDNHKYYPVSNVDKKIDISFVGAMYGNRKQFLEKIAMDFSEEKCSFYGIYVFKRNLIKYIKFIRSKMKKSFCNKKISHEDANKLYSSSKININILHEQSQSGWNARLNEILGAGGFQLISYNKLIAEKYDGMLDTFKDYDDLKKKIKYYLENDNIRNEYAQRGYNWAKDNETYFQRFNFILQELEKI
jgi:hypothetical protein